MEQVAKVQNAAIEILDVAVKELVQEGVAEATAMKIVRQNFLRLNDSGAYISKEQLKMY